MSKIRVKCDCDAGDECPQGRCGSMRRCSVLRVPRIEATIEEVPFNPILQNTINSIVHRLDEAYAEAARQTERADNLEKHCEAMQGNLTQLQISMVENFQLTDNRLDALQRTRELITSLIDYMGIEIGDYGKVQAKRQEASIKRVYKGGWVNVEHDNPGMPLRIIGLFKDKAKADACALTSRIACLQIPDITEGDGL